MKEAILTAILAVCVCALPASAAMIGITSAPTLATELGPAPRAEPLEEPPWIEGTSTATLVTEPGPYEGWYLYQMDIAWDLDSTGAGMSHWDLVLKAGCAEPDHLFAFPDPAGESTSDDFPDLPYTVVWDGYFQPDGEPTIPTTDPVLKYEQTPGQDYEAGAEGFGTFWYYANIIPETGTYEDALIGKYGASGVVYGDMTGDYPSCTVIPEPTALSLLALGGLALMRRRRR